MEPITAAQADAYLKGYSDAQRGEMIDLEFLRRLPTSTMSLDAAMKASDEPKKRKSRKKSKYNIEYSKNFKAVQNKYKTKSGSWKKDGFKKAQKEAHKLTKRSMK